eukprot:TRINITY_DN44311_c0_g1_i1.p2 TRINITY_DN44311_c0_g1~~TRINITY_DN44311_c0_g1_i1.p2  ORF type:complete len:120 (+),score=2.47 TRINITY_DN44311_c0_g1_i1:470-829(+)
MEPFLHHITSHHIASSPPLPRVPLHMMRRFRFGGSDATVAKSPAFVSVTESLFFFVVTSRCFQSSAFISFVLSSSALHSHLILLHLVYFASVMPWLRVCLAPPGGVQFVLSQPLASSPW